MSQCLIVLQVIIVLLTANSHFITASALAGPLSCDFSEEQSPLVITLINNLDIKGAELKFPRDYALSRPFESGAERGALLLRADVKDFSSYSESKKYLADGTSKVSVGICDWVRILIGSHLSMSAILNNTLSNKYKVFDYIKSGSTPVNSKSVDYGLLAPSGYIADGYMRDDVFFKRTQAR